MNEHMIRIMKTVGESINEEIDELISGVENKDEIIKILKAEIERQKQLNKYREGLNKLCGKSKIDKLRLKIVELGL